MAQQLRVLAALPGDLGRSLPSAIIVQGILHPLLASMGTRHAHMQAKHPHTEEKEKRRKMGRKRRRTILKK